MSGHGARRDGTPSPAAPSEGGAPDDDLTLPLLPVPRTSEPRTALGRWMRGERAPHGAARAEGTHPWHRVLWLTGVDYFSTLGYQPGIALLAAGALSPVATMLLVGVTLLGAVPVYSQVAKRSHAGQGSIAMLESLLPGWTGKLLVLGLLGFAATDFVITMTLSAADAAQHAIENPFLHPILGESRVAMTLAMLAVLAAVFLRGFREAIRVAMAVAIPYLALNLVVLACGLWEIAASDEVLPAWRMELSLRGDWPAMLLASAIVFPKLALGLSGFETGVAVMPLVRGRPGDEGKSVPRGRVRNTRRLLVAAAVIMSVMLLLSSVVTTMLVPDGDYEPGGKAAGRAIAFLAHRMLGSAFGTAYDAATIAILWFAGASAMAGLLNLVPRYLPRFGMAPQWTEQRRPLVLVLFAICIVITLLFDADVEAQAGAYATGVMVLMLSAAFAVALASWREARFAPGPVAALRRRAGSLYFWGVAGVFAFALVDIVAGRMDGLLIASAFIVAVLVIGAVSRIRRSTELRVSELRFADAHSRDLWREMAGKKVNLVPMRSVTGDARMRKAEDLRRHYAIRGPLAFLHVRLSDNRSDFLAPLQVRVRKKGEDYRIEVGGALAIANTIAYVSELLDPISLFLGLTGKNLMSQSIRYLLFGEGETGLMVYKILIQYWEWTPAEVEDVRPRIFIMSE